MVTLIVKFKKTHVTLSCWITWSLAVVTDLFE